MARRHLEALRELAGETAFLSILEHGTITVVDYIDSEHSVRAVPDRAEAPLHATSTGKACLAAMPDDERKSLVHGSPLERFTGRTLTSPGALASELERIADCGYAVSLGEWQADLANVGACIRGANGYPIGGVGVSMPFHRFDEGRVDSMGRALVKAGRELELAISSSRDSTE